MMRDFGHWLLLSDAGLWIGSALIWAGLLALAGLLVWRYGDVQMGPDPQPREVETQEIAQVAPDTYQWRTVPMPNWVPLQEFVDDIEKTVEAVIDLTETVEFEVVDPLDSVTPTEVIDMVGTPLFFTIKRPPPPPRLETHTQAWERDGLLARIRAAGEAAGS